MSENGVKLDKTKETGRNGLQRLCTLYTQREKNRGDAASTGIGRWSPQTAHKEIILREG